MEKRVRILCTVGDVLLTQTFRAIFSGFFAPQYPTFQTDPRTIESVVVDATLDPNIVVLLLLSLLLLLLLILLLMLLFVVNAYVFLLSMLLMLLILSMDTRIDHHLLLVLF